MQARGKDSCSAIYRVIEERYSLDHLDDSILLEMYLL
jgi:hypothetical protein